MTSITTAPTMLTPAQAATWAECFACLADPTRVRMLHAVATAHGEITVGALTQMLGISQATCSHHLRKLAKVGFVHLRKHGTSTRISINVACCTALPQAADVIMGTLAVRSRSPADHPDEVAVRAVGSGDWPAVRDLYAQAIASGNVTGSAAFETEVPTRRQLEARWLAAHRWVAELHGQVVGWAAIAPVSPPASSARVGETSMYVVEGHRGRGVGTALVHRLVTAADAAGLWTLETSVFPEHTASLALHHAAGFRTVGVRERIAVLNGRWHDTVLLERRSPQPDDPDSAAAPRTPTTCACPTPERNDHSPAGTDQ